MYCATSKTPRSGECLRLWSKRGCKKSGTVDGLRPFTPPKPTKRVWCCQVSVLILFPEHGATMHTPRRIFWDPWVISGGKPKQKGRNQGSIAFPANPHVPSTVDVAFAVSCRSSKTTKSGPWDRTCFLIEETNEIEAVDIEECLETNNKPPQFFCNGTNHLESEAWDWVYFHSYLVCHIASLTAWFDPIWLVCQHPWFGSLSFLKAVVQPTLENRRLTYLDSATRMYPSSFLNNFFVFFEFPRDLQDFEILFFSRKKKNFLRVIPTLIHFSDIVLTFHLEISGSHSFWHMLWHSLWHSIWHLFWRIFWHIFWHAFWHSIWYIFGDFLWLRSGGDHFDPEVFVWVRRCDLELAVEVRRRKEEEAGQP